MPQMADGLLKYKASQLCPLSDSENAESSCGTFIYNLPKATERFWLLSNV